MIIGQVSFTQHMQLCIGISVLHVCCWIIWLLKEASRESREKTDISFTTGTSDASRATSLQDSSADTTSNSTTRTTGKGTATSTSTITTRSPWWSYRGLCLVVQVWFSLAAMLEIFDFPPIMGIFDAHSLWHAATIPLGFLWYRFWCRDRAEYDRGYLCDFNGNISAEGKKAA
jgi:hypothetical protein